MRVDKVITVRQPWAALIVADRAGWKNIENRTWPTRHRGWIYIHAGKMPASKSEFEAAQVMSRRAGLFIYGELKLRYGGIIGMARLVDCVRRHRSPWFVGPWGWVFDRAYPLPFEPCSGQQGLWDYGSLPSIKAR